MGRPTAATSLLMIAALASAALPAAAMAPEDEASFRRDCTGDYFRFCFGLDPNGREVEQCFQARFPELSLACQATITAYLKNNPGGRHTNVTTGSASAPLGDQRQSRRIVRD